MKADLGARLLAAGGDVVDVLLARRLVSGRDVVLLLLRSDRVVHVNLPNPSGNHHLGGGASGAGEVTGTDSGVTAGTFWNTSYPSTSSTLTL